MIENIDLIQDGSGAIICYREENDDRGL